MGVDEGAASAPSTALPPPQARLPRSRKAIETAYLDGVKAISMLQGFEEERRARNATEETRLVAALLLEVVLDVRDLVAECAWRLSDIESTMHTFRKQL